MRIGHAWVSTTEQNLDLQPDALKPACDASVDPTDARDAPGLRYTYNTELNRCHILLRSDRF